MSRKRWIISYLGLDESGIRTFKIRAPEQKEYEAEQVWYSNGRVRCVGCSGPLSAMLSTCEHANAVRRAIRAGKFPDVPPLPVAGKRHRSVPPASAPAATAGTDFPRRNQMLKWTTGERAIQDAVDVVERMGADVRLTDAVILLGKARDRVADFVDGVAPESTVYPPVGEHHDFAKLLDAYERAAYGCGDYQPVEERGNYTQLVAAKRAARAQVESFVTAQATELAALRARVEEADRVARAVKLSGVYRELRRALGALPTGGMRTGTPKVTITVDAGNARNLLDAVDRAALAPHQTTEGER